MKRIGEKFTTFLNREKAWKNLDFCLIGLTFLLNGIIFGFLLAPIKRGFKIGCGNVGSISRVNSDSEKKEIDKE